MKVTVFGVIENVVGIYINTSNYTLYKVSTIIPKETEFITNSDPSPSYG